MIIIRIYDILYTLKNALSRALKRKENISFRIDEFPNEFSEYLAKCAESTRVESAHTKSTHSCAVLLVEANTFHIETLESSAYYFHALGFRIDCLVREETCLHSQHIDNIFHLPLHSLLGTLNNRALNRYDFVFFNTLVLHDAYIPHIITPKSKHGFLGFIHTLSDMERFHDSTNRKEKRLFALRHIKSPISLPILSPSILKKHYEAESSNNITLISIGFLIYHKAFRIKIQHALRDLRQNGVKISLVLVGRGALKVCDENIIMYVNPHDMDEILARHRPHFALGYYDRFAHRHYLKDSTSGLRQFALERNIPMLINEPFASSFGFDEGNAIIFRDIKKGILRATQIAQTPQYAQLKTQLEILNQNLIKQSLENLRASISHIKGEST